MKKTEKESVLSCKTQTESHDSETVKLTHEIFQFWQHYSENVHVLRTANHYLIIPQMLPLKYSVMLWSSNMKKTFDLLRANTQKATHLKKLIATPSSDMCSEENQTKFINIWIYWMTHSNGQHMEVSSQTLEGIAQDYNGGVSPKGNWPNLNYLSMLNNNTKCFWSILSAAFSLFQAIVYLEDHAASGLWKKSESMDSISTV